MKIHIRSNILQDPRCWMLGVQDTASLESRIQDLLGILSYVWQQRSDRLAALSAADPVRSVRHALWTGPGRPGRLSAPADRSPLLVNIGRNCFQSNLSGGSLGGARDPINSRPRPVSAPAPPLPTLRPVPSPSPHQSAATGLDRRSHRLQGPSREWGSRYDCKQFTICRNCKTAHCYCHYNYCNAFSRTPSLKINYILFIYLCMVFHKITSTRKSLITRVVEIEAFWVDQH